MTDAPPCTCPDCPAARELAELRAAFAAQQVALQQERAANADLLLMAQAVIDSEAAHHATVALARKVFNAGDLKRA